MLRITAVFVLLALGWGNAFGDGFSGEQAAREHFHKGVGYYIQAEKAEDSRKLYFQALGELKAADILSPGNTSFKFQLGKVFEVLGQYPEAIEQYEGVYALAGKIENKELSESLRIQATRGISSCREKSGDRKGAIAATQRNLQDGSGEGSAAGYAKLAGYALETGKLSESKQYILKISSGGPVEAGLKQEWTWKCRSRFSEADCQLEPSKIARSMAPDEGGSFYRRVAVSGPRGLNFYIPQPGAIPEMNQAILDCLKAGSYERPNCVPELLLKLEKEIGDTTEAGLKEWKLFVLGMVQYETDRFAEAQETFAKIATSGVDKRLCAAALHLQVDIAGILRQPEKELSLLDELLAKYPDYDKYPEELRTYPYCFSRERRSCLEMPAVSDIATNRVLLEMIAVLQKDLLSPGEVSSSAVISSRTVLARLYDSYCPGIWVYGKICPDALKLYKELYELAPDSPDGDGVFLKIQESKFCYEYEGDDVARNQDIVANYGPFLEKYPQSLLAPDIKKEYDTAKAFLDKLPEPYKEQRGCSSRED